MNPLFFFYPVLDALRRGTVVRRAIAYVVRAFGVLSVIGGLYLLIEIVKWAFSKPTATTIAGLVYAVLVAAAVACVFQVHWYRAACISSIEAGPFTVIPIFGQLFRIFGEVYAVAGTAVAVGGCGVIWIAGFEARNVLGPFGGYNPLSSSFDSTFLAGLAFMLLVAFASFAVLVISYFFAEATVVVADIAVSVRGIRAAGLPPALTRPVPAPTPRTCPRCGLPMEAGSRFCDNCGTDSAARAGAGR